MTSTSAHRGCICQGLSAGCLAFAKKGASRVWRDARECDGNDGIDGRRTVRAGLGALVDALIAGKRGWAGDFSVNRTLGEGPWPLVKKLDSTRCNKVTVLDSLADPRNRNGCTGPLKEPRGQEKRPTVPDRWICLVWNPKSLMYFGFSSPVKMASEYLLVISTANGFARPVNRLISSSILSRARKLTILGRRK